jgi:hypothetical protein
MFVRWKSKSLVQRQYEISPDRLKYAQLVETTWGSGKPRQKVIKYLASIRESQMGSPDHRRQFWKTIHNKLRKLELDPDLEKKIKNKLEETVPTDQNE